MNPAFSGWRSYTLVELPILLFSFSQTNTRSFMELQILELCYNTVNNGNDLLPVCRTDESPGACANKILTYNELVNLLLPALLTFFFGPRIDSYGRKPFLVAAYAGSTMSFLLWFILSLLRPLNPFIFIAASLPATLVGGYCTVILSTYCYITDIRGESDRGWHFTWLQSVISVGHVLGYVVTFATGFHYAIKFGIATVATAIATIYILFFVPESVTRRDSMRPRFSLFDPSWIKDIFSTCVRKRDGFDRILIWSCVCALSVNVLIGEGELYHSSRSIFIRYNLTNQEIFWYWLTVMLLIVAGTILGGLICRALIDRTLANMSIALLANYSAFLESIAKAFAIQLWHFYLSAFLGILGVLSGPVILNALSKSAPPQDVGKVFSLMASMEAVTTVAAKHLYFMVTLHDDPPAYPSPIYLLSVGLSACTILIAFAIKWRISKLSALNHPTSTAVELQIQ